MLRRKRFSGSVGRRLAGLFANSVESSSSKYFNGFSIHGWQWLRPASPGFLLRPWSNISATFSIAELKYAFVWLLNSCLGRPANHFAYPLRAAKARFSNRRAVAIADSEIVFAITGNLLQQILYLRGEIGVVAPFSSLLLFSRGGYLASRTGS